MRKRSSWCWMLALFLGCSGSRGPESKSTPSTVSGGAASSTQPVQAEPNNHAPFSGEIVYARSVVSKTTGIPPQSLGELHYFISGPHWKHVDERGKITALYDPITNVVHYFKPDRKGVDARQPDGPVTFEPLPATKVVLGRTCVGMRQVSAQAPFVEFYDPELYVDPKDYAAHHHGHWAEILAVTHGGLPLWDAVERDGYSLVSEAVRIVPRTFDASFWAIPSDDSLPPN
jgi:hypothetical protein